MGSFYLRLTVRDEPGVVADISAILRDQKVSLESVLQRGRDPGQPVSIILTTHETRQVAMTGAVGKIAQLKSVLEKPHLMRIEDFQS
jgi:homoserine dehydrogenase